MMPDPTPIPSGFHVLPTGTMPDGCDFVVAYGYALAPPGTVVTGTCVPESGTTVHVLEGTPHYVIAIEGLSSNTNYTCKVSFNGTEVATSQFTTGGAPPANLTKSTLTVYRPEADATVKGQHFVAFGSSTDSLNGGMSVKGLSIGGGNPLPGTLTRDHSRWIVQWKGNAQQAAVNSNFTITNSEGANGGTPRNITVGPG